MYLARDKAAQKGRPPAPPPGAPANAPATVGDPKVGATAAPTVVPAKRGEPDVVGPSVLTVIALIAIAALGYALLETININESLTGLSPSVGTIRAAIQQSVDRDLTSQRLLEALTPSVDPNPGKTPDEKKARTTARGELITRTATRLQASKSMLVDALTRRAMQPHPALKVANPSAGASTATATQPSAAAATRGTAMADEIERRLAKKEVNTVIDSWVGTALGTDARAAADAAVTGGVAAVVAPVMDHEQLLIAVNRATRPSFDPHDFGAADSSWSKDAVARLVWAMSALVLVAAFVAVVLASWGQISNVRAKWLFAIAAAVTAAIAAWAVNHLLDATIGLTPLDKLLTTYADLFDVGIARRTWVFGAIGVVGVVTVVAGALASSALEFKNLTELKDQLGAFKRLYNASALFLVASTLELYARYRWPLAFVADDTARSALETAAATFAAAVGVFYSLVLLSAYVVTTMILYRQARAILPDAPDAIDTAFTTAGFGDLTTQQTLRLAQALGPLLPGVLTGLSLG